MIEQEIKIAIPDRGAFEAIVAAFSADSRQPPRLVEQMNHYFDTADHRLARSLVMLRVRQADRVVVTLKSGTQISDGCFRSRELEGEIAAADVDRVIADPVGLYSLDIVPIEVLRTEFGVLPLTLIGNLKNRRHVFEVDEYCVEVDAMRFEDSGEEFEIEIESEHPEDARRWCSGRLEALGVGGSPASETKFQRVLRRLGC